MVRNFAFLLGLAIVVVLPVSGQSIKISGSLYDAKNKAALPYSNIVLLNARDSAVAGSMTDENGLFTLSCDKMSELTLEASSLGYRNKRWPVDMSGGRKVDMGKLYLSPDTTVLSEVNVAAQNKVVQKFDRKVYSVDEEQKAASRDIYDLLRALPGVVVDQEDNIRYKGSTPEILVDDMPAEYVYPDIAMIPVDKVEKIELIDASMRSGGDGKGGIINIKLKQATTDGFSGVLSGRTGTPDFENLSYSNGYINLNYKKGDFLIFNNFWLYGNNNMEEALSEGERRAGDVLYDTESETFNHNAYLYMYNSFGTQWEITDKTKLLMAAGMNRYTWDSESESENLLYLDDNIHQHYLKTSNNNNERLSTNAYAFLRHSFDTTLREFTAYLHYSMPDLRSKSASKNAYDYQVLEGSPVDDSSTYRTVSTDKDAGFMTGMYYNHPVSEKSRWNMRYRGRYSPVFSNESKHYMDGEPVKSQYENQEGYTVNQSLSFRFGTKLNKWKLDAGLEQEHKAYHHNYDHYTESLEDTTIRVRKQYYNLLPSATIQFAIDSLQDIKLSYSRSVRVPWAGYLSDFVVKRSPTSWSTGNPDLEPSAYNNVYLGYNYNQALWNMSAELFYSQTNNEVSYMSYPVNEILSIRMPDNIAFQSRLGADLSAYVSFNGKYSLSFSSSIYHSYIDAASLSESLEAQGVPVEEIVKRNYGFSAKLNGSMKIAKSTSGKLYLNYESRDIRFDGYDFPSFSAMASFSQHFFERKLMISLSARNLLTNLTPQGNYNNYAGVESTREVLYSTRYTPVFSLSIKYRFRHGDRNTGRVGQGMDS
ncbi:MAG: TonB-dependent receptor domain-containing protein [Bacteroidales bacterium]